MKMTQINSSTSDISNISSEIQNRINTWLTSDVISTVHKQEIQKSIDSQDFSALQDSFYQNLEFGTGGLRGIMGIGTNRMNVYTIGLATQGLANYLKKSFPDQPIKVAIAHDSRHQSPEFAQIIANVFAANNILVYLFAELRPTPELSFAIRHFGCQSGVMVTASHNPKEYNGYKAYWNDGSQLVAPHDTNVISEVQSVRLEDIKFGEKKENIINDNTVNKNIILLDTKIDDIYLNKIIELIASQNKIPNEYQTEKENFKIVYTSLHGTGITLVPKVLTQLGFKKLEIVAEQAIPDGDFPTVIYPNPEEAEALTLALKKASETNADLVLATDPDADRVGVAIKNDRNEFILLNGNQTGTLLMYYLLNIRQNNKQQDHPKNSQLYDNKQDINKNDVYIVKTIVTSDLVNTMCQQFDVECFDTLTGFKYIAAVIRENEGKKEYIGGFEESYGYLIGDFVRDKDGISSCAFIAEMAIYAMKNYGSVYEMLMQVYEKYGYFHETMVSITKKGIEGIKEIATMMDNLRANPPKMLGNSAVVRIKDFNTLLETDLENGTQTAIHSETSNVLQFFTKEGSKISARPSGTEPKIKFYLGLKNTLINKVKFEYLKLTLEAKAQEIMKELVG
jgi:phosphoglucomutase